MKAKNQVKNRAIGRLLFKRVDNVRLNLRAKEATEGSMGLFPTTTHRGSRMQKGLVGLTGSGECLTGIE